MNHPSPAASALHASAPDQAGPVREHERIITLDVLRGFALFGILMVNIFFFSMPFMLSFYDPSLADGPLSEQLAFGIVAFFFQFKFISLFSLLFGIGFVVQLMRAKRRGGDFVPVYLRRLGILFFIGLAHALGLWYGDVLLFYAVIGVALLLCASFSPRTLIALAIISLLIGTVLWTGLSGLQHMAMSDAADHIEEIYAEAEQALEGDDVPSGFEAMSKANFDPINPLWQDAELRAFRDGPLSDALAFRSFIYMSYLIVALFSYAWHILAMFLLGAALMKLNFFAPENHAWHRRLAFIALPIGLLMEGAYTAVYWAGGFDLYDLRTVLMMPVHEIGSVVLMLGYVGVICLIVHSGLLTWLTTPLAAAGRMALTVYLCQTVIATGIMYWWGLGMFGSFSRTELIGLAVLIYAVLVIFSMIWLKIFRYGPMEWLWRSLTYLRPQPLLRRAEND